MFGFTALLLNRLQICIFLWSDFFFFYSRTSHLNIKPWLFLVVCTLFTTYKQHQLRFYKTINPIEMLIWISTPPWACCYKLSEREKEIFFVNIAKQTVLMGSLKSCARVKMDLRFPVSPLRKTSLRRLYRAIFTKLQKRSFSKHPPLGITPLIYKDQKTTLSEAFFFNWASHKV